MELFCGHKKTSELACLVPGVQPFVLGIEVPLRLSLEAWITAVRGGILIHL